MPVRIFEGVSETLNRQLQSSYANLELTETEAEAWASFFYWACHGKVAPFGDGEFPVDNLLEMWILGDKYDIKTFQDLAMYKLLEDLCDCRISVENVFVAFSKHEAGSKLRMLMAAEVARLLKDPTDTKFSNLGDLEKIEGYQEEVVEALKQSDLIEYKQSRLTRKDENGESIAPDQLIDIHVGANTCNPSEYRVSAHILSGISNVLAAQIEQAQLAAENKTFGDRLKLAYPNDKKSSWEMLLFWAYNKRLPKVGQWEQDIVTLLDAWLLGDELAAPMFQDAIMLDLLKWHGSIEPDTLAYACDHLKPGSTIARFMAEEAIFTLATEGLDNASIKSFYAAGMNEDDVEEKINADPGTGDLVFIAAHNKECRRAQGRFNRFSWSLFDRFTSGRTTSRQWWMEFMVGSEIAQKDIYGGVNGPVVQCFKPEPLAEAVTRVCEDEDAVTVVDQADVDDRRSAEMSKADGPKSGEYERKSGLTRDLETLREAVEEQEDDIVWPKESGLRSGRGTPYDRRWVLLSRRFRA